MRAVDVWQADADGLLRRAAPRASTGPGPRGVLRTDAEGRLRFRARDAGGLSDPHRRPGRRACCVATRRHPWRPAHVHFMIQAPGYETLITHVFRDGDPYLDSDAVFGVRASLIGDFVAHAAGTGPHARESDRDFHTLDFDFVLAREAVASTAD